jgi:toxin-antitoxin system PIN domain toxin
VILCDVHIFVYAFRRDLPRHGEARAWLTETIHAPGAFGISDLVSSAFLRIVTSPRIFHKPSKIGKALDFLAALRGRPNAVNVRPGIRHWSIFEDLCRDPEVHGDRIPDAWFAALAIESGSEWITTDRGFARFPALRWRDPID